MNLLSRLALQLWPGKVSHRCSRVPRLALAKDFRLWTDVGRKLRDVHRSYEQAPRHELPWIETPGRPAVLPHNEAHATGQGTRNHRG